MNQIKLHNESNNYKATNLKKNPSENEQKLWEASKKNSTDVHFISELMTLQQPWICGPESWSC